MPKAKIITRLENQLKAKGVDKKSAARIAVSQMQKAGNVKKGGVEATSKGKKRAAMGAGGRAKDRAIKRRGKGKASDYKYSKKTNRATLRKR